jgi:DNA-binding CsgD family transcriptional regulator
MQAKGDYQTQFSLSKRVIELHRELGDRNQLAIILSTTSFLAMSLANYADAHTMLEEALPLLHEIGNPYRIAMALNFSGDLARCEQNYHVAYVTYEESISLLRTLDAPRDLASALQNQGFTCLHLGEDERAYALFNEGMTIQLAQQNTPGLSECLLGFAATAAKFGLLVAGAQLLAAAEKFGGLQITASRWAATKLEYECYLALFKAQLTENEFQSGQVEGHKFTLEQAVEYAQHLSFQPGTSPVLVKRSNDLTAREREITRLIANGKSNGEIANELVLSKRTVEKHIAHILIRLGLTNRAQIVRWAIETGLVEFTH